MRHELNIKVNEVKKIIINDSIEKEKLIEAALARYKLDYLLLGKEELIRKWGQFRVVNKITDKVLFQGTERNCKKFIENDIYKLLDKLDYLLPTNCNYNWKIYTTKVNIIKISNNIRYI